MHRICLLVCCTFFCALHGHMLPWDVCYLNTQCAPARNSFLARYVRFVQMCFVPTSIAEVLVLPVLSTRVSTPPSCSRSPQPSKPCSPKTPSSRPSLKLLSKLFYAPITSAATATCSTSNTCHWSSWPTRTACSLFPSFLQRK